MARARRISSTQWRLLTRDRECSPHFDVRLASGYSAQTYRHVNPSDELNPSRCGTVLRARPTWRFPSMLTRSPRPWRAVALPLVFIATVAQAQSHITSPKEQFGHNIGDDYWLATYDQFQAYWQKLAKESDRKSTRLNSSHVSISYAVFC